MRAGRLKHRVTIERATMSRDDYGEEIETFATLVTVWAGIEPTSGKENIHGGKEASLNSYNIIMRYTDITPHDRINWSAKGRVFNVESILNRDEINKQLTISAVENV